MTTQFYYVEICGPWFRVWLWQVQELHASPKASIISTKIYGTLLWVSSCSVPERAAIQQIVTQQQYTIVGSWRRSQDLPQVALELPCTLTFSADSIMVSKVEALLAAKKINSSVGPEYSHTADDNSPKNTNQRQYSQLIMTGQHLQQHSYRSRLMM